MRRLALLASASPWTEASFQAAAKNFILRWQMQPCIRAPREGHSYTKWRATSDWSSDYRTSPVTAFYIRGCQEKKVLPRLVGAKKFLLTSSPCIEVRIRDCSVSPDSSRWRDDVVRLMTQQAVRLSGGNHGSI